MNNSETFFKNLLGVAGKNLIDLTDDRNKAATFRLTLALLGILTFVGREAIIITFRRNFPEGSLSLFRIILCFLGFAGLGVLFFSLSFDTGEDFIRWSGNPSSYKVTGVLIFLVGLFVLIKGIIEFIKSRNYSSSNLNGESYLYKVLSKDGWKNSLIQNFAEPFIFILIGGIYSIYNFIGFIPLAVCSISYWLNLLIVTMFDNKPLNQQASKMNTKNNQEKKYYEVNN